MPAGRKFGTLQREQTDFFINASGITGQAAVRSEDTVAWYNDRNRIVSHGTANSLGGHMIQTSFSGNLTCDVSISSRFPVRDCAENFPDLFLEFCSHKVQRDREIRIFSCEIKIEPALC